MTPGLLQSHTFRAVRLWVGFWLALGLAGCGTTQAAPPPSATSSQPTATALPPPQARPTVAALATGTGCPVEAPWTASLGVSGGFAGVDRRIEVDSSGAYRAEDLQSGKKVEGSLPEDTLALIEAQLSAICLASSEGRPPACADCFLYTVEVTSSDGTATVLLNDISLPSSPAAPLVATLSRTLNEALPY